MSLEYLLLTFIALNGSRMWINGARERGSRVFPLMVMMMSMPGVRHVQTALRAAAGLIPSEP